MAKQVFDVGGTKVRAETLDQANKIAGEINAVPTTPTGTAAGVIPVSSLTTPAPAPIQVPTQPTATSGAAVDSMIGTQAKQGVDQFTQDQATATKQAEAGYTNSLDAVLKQLTSTEGQTALTAKEYAGSVDPAKKALNDINQQILADQEAERQQIIRIKENPNGVFGGALEQQIQELQDKGIQRRAGLAVTQLAAQGNYQLAKEIADRAVEATLERQKIKTDTLQFIYTQNKELFTKAEQRQFETAQADRNRKLEMDAYKEKAKYDQIIKQSDPQYQATLAKTYADIANTQKNTTLNGKPQTATQAQVQGYADRTNQADVIIGKIGAQFTGIKSYAGQFLPNFLKTGDRQAYEQAQRNFVNAVLRRESGAVISPSEFANAAQQYFPQPGDSSQVMKQKELNRQTVVNNLYQQSNVERTPLPGQVIEDASGKKYEVGDDGITLTEI